MSGGDNTGEILEVPVGEIGPGPLVRADRFDLDHVARLRPVIDQVPAIVIRETAKGWSLIDGAHRLAAHKAEDREAIRAVVVALDDAEALEAAIEANIAHGLTLTGPERKAAARKLVESTKYGDARIAQICGLGAGTVADLRPKCPGVDLDTRTGLDGKDYPSPAVAKLQRERATAAYTADPTLSVRALAAAANCSKGIAEAVIAKHKAAEQGPDAPLAPAPNSGLVVNPPVDEGQADETEEAEVPAPPLLGLAPPVADGPPAVGDVIDHYPTAGDWAKADGATKSNAARDFARFMDRRTLRDDEAPAAVAAACPAELRRPAFACARVQAAQWTALADALEQTAVLAPVEEAR